MRLKKGRDGKGIGESCYIYDIIRGRGTMILDGIRHGEMDSKNSFFEGTNEMNDPKINRPTK